MPFKRENSGFLLLPFFYLLFLCILVFFFFLPVFNMEFWHSQNTHFVGIYWTATVAAATAATATNTGGFFDPDPSSAMQWRLLVIWCLKPKKIYCTSKLILLYATTKTLSSSFLLFILFLSPLYTQVLPPLVYSL